jgi:hypothetical protein
MNQIKGLEVVKQAVEQTEIEQLRAQLAQAQAENANLKAKSTQRGSVCKVTAKGGLSVYGLGRFPVTLYKSQWFKLIGMVEEIKAFIEANGDKLTDKPGTQADAEEVA